MAIDIQSGPSVLPATFVAQAIDAGLDVTIISLVGLGKTEQQLLEMVKESLQTTNKPLADALTLDAFRAVLRYIAATRKNIALSAAIPELLDADGPAAIWPVYYGGTEAQAQIGTPTEEDWKRARYVGFHLLLDGAIYYSGKLPADPADNIIAPISLPAGKYTARVCYFDAQGNITRLSPAGEFTVKAWTS